MSKMALKHFGATGAAHSSDQRRPQIARFQTHPLDEEHHLLGC